MNDANEKKPQRDRFIETARALGADEGETAFKAKLAVIARHKPKDAKPVRDKKDESA
jgi:hypothetical protein